MAFVVGLRNSWSFLVRQNHHTIKLALTTRKETTKNIFRTLSLLTMPNECEDGRKCAGISTSCVSKKENFVTKRDIEEVEKKWKKKFLNNTSFGEAVFVLGAMGAGKTTIIENEFRCHPIFSKYAVVDTDDIMGMLHGFASDKVEEYYPIAREIAIRLTDWILDQRISFIAEGTCVKYLELIDYLKRLKTVGYEIRVKRLPNVPLDVVLERSKHRKNRLVPDHVVKSIYLGSKEGLDKLYFSNEKNRLFEDVDTLNRNGVVGQTGKALNS